MKRVLRDERGMALAVAIFALVVVGALVAGAFFAGTQEQKLGDNTRRMQQAFGVAELGVNEVIRNWDPETINITPIYPGGSFTIPLTATASGSYGGTIYKLNNQQYLIDITGVDRYTQAGRTRGTGARQRIGLLARIRLLDVNVQAALTTRGGVALKGNALVNGKDTIPTGWSTANCDTIGDTTKAGVRTPDSTQVSTQRSDQLYGNPKVRQDTSVHSGTFTQFGDVTYDQLAAAATLQIPSGNYRTEPVLNGAGGCNKSQITNWGDGANRAQPCGNYFPIIHVQGDVTLNGVQGQGILLVDGNLQVQGSYTFYGVVIVQGTLETAGGGSTDAHFYGGVMARNVDLELNSLAGNATLQYSKCAVTQALEMTGVVSQQRSRGWTQLY